MRSATTRIICRFLVISLIWLPFHTAQAGMIGTEQVAATASAQADREAVLAALTRSDVASQLQSLGIDANAAKDRVASLTDSEVRTLAGQMETLPAGADAGGTILLLLIIGAIVWYFWFK